MKKILLSFVLCALSVTGISAQNGYTVGQGQGLFPDKAIRVTLNQEGALADAIAWANGSEYDHIKFYGTINAADVEALKNFNKTTIDLSEVTVNVTGTAKYEFAGSNLKNVILPKGIESIDPAWFKTTINAAFTYTVKNANETSLEAYVMTPNTLKQTISMIAITNNEWNDIHTDLGSVGPHNYDLEKCKYVKISGNVAAKDFGGSSTTMSAVYYDADGHLQFSCAADEKSTAKWAGVDGTRTPIGTKADFSTYSADEIKADITKFAGGSSMGAITFAASGICSLDLSGAIIDRNHNDDLTLTRLGYYTTDSTYPLTKVMIPECESVWKIPADFISGFNNIHEICIPSNITTIQTRAFQVNQLQHIWTTSHSKDTETTNVWDNGSMPQVDGELHTGYYDGVWDATNWGTYTFSSNLQLIESNAFCGSGSNVKDVYVLAVEAPECHVDAFNTKMYVGNNGYNPVITDGIITRESYTGSTGEFITMLHYPRETVTPNTQRYTDPQRRYSIATGLRDGKGGIIYFPNQAEFARAYEQGTYGYTWNAFDPERATDGSGGFLNGKDGDDSGSWSTSGWLAQYQDDSNKKYNAYYNRSNGANKNSVFYETGGEGVTITPKELTDYWTLEWKENDNDSYHQLYPRATVVETGETITHQNVDDYGNPKFNPCEDGDYKRIANNTYVKDDNGTFVKDIVVTEAADGPKVQDYEYVEYTGTPVEGETYYYHPIVTKNWDSAGPFYSQSQDYEAITDGNYTEDDYVKSPYDPGTYVKISEYLKWGYIPTPIENMTKYRMVYVYTENEWGDYIVSPDFEVLTSSSELANINSTLYTKEYIADSYRDYNAATDEGETRYYVTDNGGYRDYNAATDEGKQKYSEQTVYTFEQYAEGETIDQNNRWCPEMITEPVLQITYNNDYRGWHQFVLVGTTTNNDDPEDPFTPYRSYITDNDWWTLCSPFDMTRADLIKFFGKENGDLPYVSRLLYVIRDVDNRKVNLFFSKNLMNYVYVNTTPDATTKVTTATLGTATPGENDVVVKAGVPYMIRPNIDTSANRQFDVYKKKNGELYDRITESLNMPGSDQMDLIYNGMYTVPAYNVNNHDTQNEPEGTDPYIIEYQNGATVEAKLSTKYTYTFVGTFYNSLLPQYAYFLGWVGSLQSGHAAFFYNRTPDTQNWRWTNETGIIMANWAQASGSDKINPATDLTDPARWIVTAGASNNDDYAAGSSSSTTNKSFVEINFGANDVTGIAEVVTNDTKAENDGNIYSIGGQYVGKDLKGLAKGIYVKNGKKIVVK